MFRYRTSFIAYLLDTCRVVLRGRPPSARDMLTEVRTFPSKIVAVLNPYLYYPCPAENYLNVPKIRNKFNFW